MLGHNLESRTRVSLPADTRPILIVVVDTEEEFDWTKQFDRSSTGVTAINELHRGQAVFDDFGLRPIYVIDYPVASTESSFSVLKELRESERAHVGLQLHSWVSPPLEEEITRANSYSG